MDRLRKEPAEASMKPYNHSIAIIQSSGMGKSRLVDSTAERKFCFPFNIRGDLPRFQYGNVLVIFAIYILSYITQHTRHPTSKSISISKRLNRTMNNTLSACISHFFAALFECGIPELQTLLDQDQVNADSISGTWRTHLALGATEYAVGHKRRKFYKKVTRAATQKVHIYLL